MEVRQRELRKLLVQAKAGVNQAVCRLSEGRIRIAKGVVDQLADSRHVIQKTIEDMALSEKIDVRIEIKKLLKERQRDINSFADAVESKSVSAAKTISKWIVRTDDRLAELLITD